MNNKNNSKNVLYICSYYLDDVCEQRNSYPYISQAGMNKANFMIDAMQHSGYHVYVWSNAWTSSRCFKRFKGFQSKINPDVYYSDIFGAPLFNVLSCMTSGKRFVDQFLKEHSIDLVVFYNMRIESSWLANYIKKNYGIPIVLEYEDGLEVDINNSPAKRVIYRYVQRKIKPQLDGAVLVNSLVRNQFPCRNIIIRGAAKKVDAQLLTKPQNRKLKILFSGTLDEQRGILVLLESLKHTKLDFDMYITGKGPLDEEVKKCTDPRLHYIGYVSYEEYQELLAGIDVCINAQKSSFRFGIASFPSKIFEYLSMKKLVISSDVSDVESYLGHAVLIYHNDDPKDLARQIEHAAQVYENENELAVYQQKITECIENNSAEQVAKKFKELFQACCHSYTHPDANTAQTNRMKVLFYTNIPSPYRVDFFNEMGKYCDLTVLFEISTSTEREVSWHDYNFQNFNGIILNGRRTSVDTAFCPGILKYLKKDEYDYVIVAMLASATAVMAVTALRMRGIPYYYEGDGGFVKSTFGFRAAIKKYIISHAQKCLSTAREFDKYCLAYGTKPDNIARYPFTSIRDNEILLNPVDPQVKWEKKKAMGITEECAIVSVGRYVHRKGFDLLLEVSRNLPENVGIYIVGGKPTPEYQNYKDEYHLDHVHFVEFMNKEKLMDYYQTMDAFVLLTREDPWGLVINEAMANGLPVISTNKCIAATELVEDGVEGFLVESENLEQIEQALLKIAESSELRERMAENAIRKIQNYTIETMAKSHIDFLSKEKPGRRS